MLYPILAYDTHSALVIVDRGRGAGSAGLPAYSQGKIKMGSQHIVRVGLRLRYLPIFMFSGGCAIVRTASFMLSDLDQSGSECEGCSE